MDFENQEISAYGGDFGQLATPYYHRPFPVYQNIPSLSPVLGLVAGNFVNQLIIPRLFSSQGVTPFGLGHEQNVYDIIKNMEYTRAKNMAIQAAAANDYKNYFESFRGLAAITGTPFGYEQRLAAKKLAQKLASASGTMYSSIPEHILDAISGPTGSYATLTNYIMDTGRSMVDPYTGKVGLAPQTAANLAKTIYDQLYKDGTTRQTHGIKAGEVGALFAAMQAKGLISAGTQPKVTETLVSSRIAAGAASAMGDLGFGIPGVVDALTTLTAPHDINRIPNEKMIANTIAKYTKAITVIREIFGDKAKNAPMPALLKALDEMASGALHQHDPERLANNIRVLNYAAKEANIQFERAYQIQQHVANRLIAAGQDPATANEIATQAIYTRTSYGKTQMINAPPTGALSADALAQFSTHMATQAQQSIFGRRAAAIFRLAETAEADTEAAAYRKAMLEGKTTYIYGGRLRSTALTPEDTTRIAKQLGINNEDLNLIMEDPSLKFEFAKMPGFFKAAVIAQQKEIEDLAGQITVDKLGVKLQPEEKKEVVKELGQLLISRDFASDAERDKAVADFFRTRLKTEIKPAELQSLKSLLSTTISQWYQGMSLPALQQFFVAQAGVEKEETKAKTKAEFADRFMHLRAGTAISRLFAEIAKANPNDEDALRGVIAGALGGRSEDIRDIAITTATQYVKDVLDLQKEFDEITRSNLPDEERNKKLEEIRKKIDETAAKKTEMEKTVEMFQKNRGFSFVDVVRKISKDIEKSTKFFTETENLLPIISFTEDDLDKLITKFNATQTPGKPQLPTNATADEVIKAYTGKTYSELIHAYVEDTPEKEQLEPKIQSLKEQVETIRAQRLKTARTAEQITAIKTEQKKAQQNLAHNLTVGLGYPDKFTEGIADLQNALENMRPSERIYVATDENMISAYKEAIDTIREIQIEANNKNLSVKDYLETQLDPESQEHETRKKLMLQLGQSLDKVLKRFGTAKSVPAIMGVPTINLDKITQKLASDENQNQKIHPQKINEILAGFAAFEPETQSALLDLAKKIHGKIKNNAYTNVKSLTDIKILEEDDELKTFVKATGPAKIFDDLIVRDGEINKEFFSVLAAAEEIVQENFKKIKTEIAEIENVNPEKLAEQLLAENFRDIDATTKESVRQATRKLSPEAISSISYSLEKLGKLGPQKFKELKEGYTHALKGTSPHATESDKKFAEKFIKDHQEHLRYLDTLNRYGLIDLSDEKDQKAQAKNFITRASQIAYAEMQQIERSSGSPQLMTIDGTLKLVGDTGQLEGFGRSAVNVP